MIIFKDYCTDKEWFTDAYKMGVEGPEDFLLTIRGKMVTRKLGGGISADLIGGNPSQEEQDEQADDTEQVESGIDVVLDSKLEDHSDFFCSKKALQSHLKKWLKKVAGKIENAEKCESFKKCCASNIMEFISKWSKDASVYTTAEFAKALQ